MSKSLEELKNEKLRELSSGFDQNNNINVFSKWSYEEGWKDAIKAVSERDNNLVYVLEKISDPSSAFMGTRSESFREWELRLIAREALKDYRGMK